MESRLNQSLFDEKMQVMNFLNEITLRYPDAISFAPGRPLERFFDVEKSISYMQSYVDYMQEHRGGDFGDLGQYGRTNGMIGELIARLLRNDEGIQVTAQDIVVTVGCQEAMCISLLALCGNPGDVTLVADPAYIGISGAAKILGVEALPVPFDDQGLDLEKLQDQIDALAKAGKRAGVLYLSPDFANPTGLTLSLEQRQALLELTRKYQITVLEDHAYNYFCYTENRLPALKSLEGAEHVIFLGSFSKSIFPGLRLGFAVTEQKIDLPDGQTTSLSDEMSKIKSMLTVNTSPLCQAIAGGILVNNDCSLQDYTQSRRETLKGNLDAMLVALSRYFPKDSDWANQVSWTAPEGGFFLTMKLPFEVTNDDLLTSAEQFGVVWTPMSDFYMNKANSNQIRLSFSYVNHEQIDQGIANLARLIEQRISRIGFVNQTP